MPRLTLVQRLEDAWRDATTRAASLSPLVAGPLAIGWATVDLDRATRELATALGLGAETAFRAAPRCAALGGACRVAPSVLPGGGALVVLEPDSEGRLAASLARLDEGPVATWLACSTAGTQPPVGDRDPLGEGLTLSTESDGPLGPERLILDGRTTTLGRSWRLIVRAAGTIQP